MADLLPELFAAISHLRSSSYTCAAGGTILFYDILLTTKQEVNLIWPSKFSLVKCLYFVNRYFPIFCLLLGQYHLAALRPAVSTEFCQLVVLSQIVGQALGLIAATWLLVIRVVALYGGNLWIAIAVYTIFISTHSASIAIAIAILKKGWNTIYYSGYVSVCTQDAPHYLGGIYYPPVACEVALATLQLFHAYHYSYRARKSTPLLRTLYADGFLYFLVVASLRLWSALNFTMADHSYWYLTTYLEFSLVSTSVSRLVLHLRGAALVHEDDEDSSDGTFAGLPVISPDPRDGRHKRYRSSALFSSDLSMQSSRPHLSLEPPADHDLSHRSYLSPNLILVPDTPTHKGTPLFEKSKLFSKSGCPFRSGAGYVGAMFNLPSSSGGWSKRKCRATQEKEDRRSGLYVDEGDGDSYMEMSPVTPSKGRNLRSMDEDAQTSVPADVVSEMKEKGKQRAEDTGSHETGIG